LSQSQGAFARTVLAASALGDDAFQLILSHGLHQF
jgi:hypothetical protein